MNVVLIADGPEQAVVKLPRRAYGAYYGISFEADVISSLHETSSPPPLEIPEIVDCRPWEPQHLILSKVPGSVLTYAEIQKLQPDEKRMLGREIGEHVAWMAGALSFEMYADIKDFLPSLQMPDRIDNIIRYGKLAYEPDLMDDTLAQVLMETLDAYRRYAKEGRLEPNIIGHDDLRPGNIAFQQRNGDWRPTGVFDFGITKPSSPERELRHMASIDLLAGEAAIEAYEAAVPGYHIDRELMRFWAIGQAATSCAYSVVAGQPGTFDHKVAWLGQLMPEYDWSELLLMSQASAQS